MELTRQPLLMLLMLLCFILIVPAQDTTGDGSSGIDDPSVRATNLKCRDPAGRIGKSFVRGCLKKTCTRNGKKTFWKKVYTRNECCNYDQEWLKIGENITEIAPDNCTIVHVHCAKYKKAAPKIMMDTTNSCVNDEKEEEATLEPHCCSQVKADGAYYQLRNSTKNQSIICPSSCVYGSNESSQLFCYDTISNKSLCMAVEGSKGNRGQSQCATVYLHGGFGGSQLKIPLSSLYNLPGNWNDQISSWTVVSGCSLTVYEHGSAQGNKWTGNTADNSWIGSYWNDRISSTSCTCPGRTCATVYEAWQFGGSQLKIPLSSSYNLPGNWNDKISSWKVSSGCSLTVYEHSSAQGNQWAGNNGDTRWPGMYWNDRISSTNCYCPGWGHNGWSYCSASEPCGYGQGDCDKDSECGYGLICDDYSNNCQDFDSTAHSAADCCIKGCRCGTSIRQNRIVGGQETEVNEYPWIALLSIEKNGGHYRCSGSLIASQWVVTAAHCVFHDDKKTVVSSSKIKVILGEHDTSNNYESKIPRKEVKVSKIIPHDVPQAYKKDIALLKLSENIDLNTYTPVCVPNAGEDFTGKYAWTYGWGALYTNGPLASKLQEVAVKIVSDQTCQAAFDAYGKGGTVSSNEVCAGGVGGKDSCGGDSGGPLSLPVNNQHTLAGIVSWGIDCALPNMYGVYVETAKFKSWLDTTMAANGGMTQCPA